jgi:hypothetical protein
MEPCGYSRLGCTAMAKPNGLEHDIRGPVLPAINQLINRNRITAGAVLQSSLGLPSLTMVIRPIADVAGARGRDPGFNRRVRLSAGLDAFEEILHV